MARARGSRRPALASPGSAGRRVMLRWIVCRGAGLRTHRPVIRRAVTRRNRSCPAPRRHRRAMSRGGGHRANAAVWMLRMPLFYSSDDGAAKCVRCVAIRGAPSSCRQEDAAIPDDAADETGASGERPADAVDEWRRLLALALAYRMLGTTCDARAPYRRPMRSTTTVTPPKRSASPEIWTGMPPVGCLLGLVRGSGRIGCRPVSSGAGCRLAARRRSTASRRDPAGGRGSRAAWPGRRRRGRRPAPRADRAAGRRADR